MSAKAKVRGVMRRDGEVMHSSQMGPEEWRDDYFGRTTDSDAGFYVWFGMWKGPFDTAEAASEACREWLWESKHG